MRVLLIASAILFHPASTPATSADSGQDSVIKRIVAALNTKDRTKIKEFIVANFTDPSKLEMRVERLAETGNQGAPFEYIKPLRAEPGHEKALIKDKEGITLALDAEVSPPPESKIVSMRIQPYDETPVKDYRKYQSLSELAASIRKDSNSPAMGISVLKGGAYQTVVVGNRTVSGAKVGKDEPWSVGSIGKSLCTTVIGKLIETKKLKWDSTLGELIPDLIIVPEYRAITLEQLMHHRGGVPTDPGMRKAQVDKIVSGEKDPVKIRLNYAKDILSRPLISKPGTSFAYSNAGFTLLGVVAERVTGKSYDTLVKEFIFAPLGLKHSYTELDQLPKERPSGHIGTPNGPQEMNMGGPLEALFAPAGGGMFMSLEDLAKFGKSHLDGLNGKDGLLKSSTIMRLHQGVPERPDGRMQYACGWGLETFDGLEVMHAHNGSNGTMRAQLSIFPKMGIVIASFVNAGGETEPSPPLQAVLAIAHKTSGK
jgi:D-alanyl-D-alanine carboxypeptidase